MSVVTDWFIHKVISLEELVHLLARQLHEAVAEKIGFLISKPFA